MWLAASQFPPPERRTARRFAVAVAIPARNEAARITACLAALDAAAARAQGWVDTLTVLVVANNCSDATATCAMAYRPRHYRLRVKAITLAPADAHAGGARRQALALARAGLLPDDVLMTSDADSCVDPGWIAANLHEIASGADVVAGTITLSPGERATLPPLPGRDLEWRLAEIAAEIEDHLDPVAHDRWPRHIWAWGASLALTVAAHDRIGGVPAIPLAEDRALAEAVLRHDLRLRHSPYPLVYTSARLIGRAPGGFADLVKGFAENAGQPCDAALEPVADLVRRLRWRRRLRHAWDRDGAAAALTLNGRPWAEAMPACFGSLWHWLEQRSPSLRRRRLLPADLPGEVAMATTLLDRFRAAETNPCDNPAAARA
ncbi:MAG: hypothetical protein RL490_2672 [Pseudomonadota bacterium]